MCDQGTNNVRALNILVEDTKAKYLRDGKDFHDFIFEIDGQSLIPLFDVPHLLKGVRNNLLTKDIHYSVDNCKKIAKWNDIYKTWLLDNQNGELLIMTKINQSHVDKQKMRKMKVSSCAQVFSHTVSAAINLMAKSKTELENIKMEERAVGTAHFLNFMDKLFDNLNGFAPFNKGGKILKTQINCTDDETAHTTFWKKAVTILSTAYCVDGNNKK